MKALTKKTLAMILAFAMSFSLCSFTAAAADVPVTGITIEAEKTTIGVGESITITAAVEPSNATNDDVTWTASGSAATVNRRTGELKGKKAGTVTVTATAKDDSDVTASIDIEVKPIVEVTGSIEVPYGTSKSEAIEALNDAKLELKYDGGSFEGKYTASWTADKDYHKNGTELGTFTFTFAKGEVTGEAEVTVVPATLKDDADAELPIISVSLGTDFKKVEKKFKKNIELELDNGDSETFSISDDDDADFAWWACDDEYDKDEAGTYVYKAVAADNEIYDLPDLIQTVVVYDDEYDDIDMHADAEGEYLADAAEEISDYLYSIFGAEMDNIEFTKITGYNEDKEKESNAYVGGTLYTEDDCAEEVSTGDDTYTYEEMEEMFFLPSGNGRTTYIYYTAYADEDDARSVDGRIVITSDQYLRLTAEIKDSDVVNFDSNVFEEAFLDLDNDYEELDMVTFSNIPESKSEGYLYYDYDTKDEELVDDDDEFYVAATKYQLDLDDVTYVPGKSTEGVITIGFTAYGYDDDDDDVEVDGIIQITVVDEADIIVEAGKKETVVIDIEEFEDFLYSEEKTRNIAYVVIDGAPYSDTYGYLTCEGEEFQKSGDKTFHTDPDKDEYDLEDLCFVGGTKLNTKRADFEIYYYKSNGTSIYSSPVTGSIEFITGASRSISGTIKASETMSFATGVSAFKDMGGNDNEYVVFTKLPVGGKLVYNWATSTQADVKIGEKYYLSYMPGQKLLNSVTFVPSYSADKTQKTISMDVKGVSKDNKEVEGKVNITVVYASRSAQFTDIITSTYADSVDFLYNQKITTGMTATTFGPNNNVTRAQFVTFLWRAAGSPTVTGVTNKFPDVKSTGEYAYAYQAILWAVQNNITTGRSATQFAPGANVTHQELLTFLYRYDVNYLKHPATTSSYVSYTDWSSVSAYAQTPVKWADSKGILSGYTIQPTVAGSRATVALWLHRMLTL